MPETSLTKVKANRKNAKKSTGPKTDKGKNVVKHNALKHGLLAKEVIITDGDGQENRTQFTALLKRLQTELLPIGVLEEILIEKIAVYYWRLRRVLRCEVGEIRKRLDNLEMTSFLRRIDQSKSALSLATLDPERSAYKESSLGVRRLIDTLETVREMVEDSGKLTDDEKQQLLKVYGGERSSLAHYLMVINELGESDETSVDEPIPEDSRKGLLLHTIDKELGIAKEMEILHQEREKLEVDSALLGASLPHKEAVDKILRYETTIERQLYRAMDQLERLQRHRKGEAVPPPINVALNNQT